MAPKGRKPASGGKTKAKGPDTSKVKLDDAGRFKPQEGELSDETLDKVSGGTIYKLTDACKPPKPPPKPLQVCCPSVNLCRPK
jgi:hypothetical protein